jgi:Fur family ferric uptake transcriptional regulator
MTQQRELILRAIREHGSHPTADEVYMWVRERLPSISLGTVYRNLDSLSSCGLIKKLEPAHTQKKFDGNTTDHYHNTCVCCGRIDDLSFKPSDNPLENLENALGNLTKYGIFGHKLEFVGLCPECMAEGKEFAGEEERGFD